MDYLNIFYHFEHRYMPVGKVAKPADGATSLSQGGACHMGRPAQLPKTRLATKLCRKIYTNHTHIVARCFFSRSETVYTVSWVH